MTKLSQGKSRDKSSHYAQAQEILATQRCNLHFLTFKDIFSTFALLITTNR